MRAVGLLLGLIVAGAVAVGVSTVSPGPEPALVTAGAGLLGTGVVGLAVSGIDVAAERYRIATPIGRWRERDTGLSKVDRLGVGLGAGAVFVRVALVHLVADPFHAVGATLTLAAVVTIGVVLGYRTAGSLLDGLRHGVLACGFGGALCVSLAAYDATTLSAVEAASFDAVVAGSGLVLPVGFGLFGGVSGAVGWWLADWLAGADPLA